MGYKLDKTYTLGANEGASQRAGGKIAFIHSTANVGASAKNNAAFEKRTWRNAYVHFIAGDGVVYQVGEPGYVAWGVGPTGNGMAPVQIEMEETNDSAKFKRIYATTIELLRNMAKKYSIPLTLDTAEGTGIKSHRWASNKWHQSDHTDPYGYLSKHGISKAQFAKDLKNGVGSSASTPAKKATYLKAAKQVKAKTSVTRYHDKAFKKKELTFKPGTIFDIASVVGYGKITRLKLGNGLYITSNTDYVKKLK
ncbi:N-acetylmuramoyl-L-alanine amidase [Levilactobacillus brevis]|nr:N-acetylmuramoyl-L-alanine amidase [Levilactobacillus brevis]